MTQQAELISKIKKLPPQYLSEVVDFVGYLQHKALNSQKAPDLKIGETPKGREFGCSKGKYQVTEAFFEPLEDFREYM